MVSGWGESGGNESYSNTLKYVKVPPVSDTACAATEPGMGAFDTETMMCAGQNKTQCVINISCESYFM